MVLQDGLFDWIEHARLRLVFVVRGVDMTREFVISLTSKGWGYYQSSGKLVSRTDNKENHENTQNMNIESNTNARTQVPMLT